MKWCDLSICAKKCLIASNTFLGDESLVFVASNPWKENMGQKPNLCGKVIVDLEPNNLRRKEN